MSELIAKDLKKSYGKKDIVKGVSLQVGLGECVGLLGPNGAGKTTTFYMISGLVKPNEGSVFLSGEDITHSSISSRSHSGLGYLPQEASIFRKMTTYENIYTALELSKYNGDKRKRTDELIAMFNLGKVFNSQGFALSGGERRRVEVARCIATEAKFLLLDEPFAGIDPISISDIQNMVEDLKNFNIGLLITDHNVRETLGISDRAYILIDGQVVVDGKSSEVINHPEVQSRYLGEEFKL